MLTCLPQVKSTCNTGSLIVHLSHELLTGGGGGGGGSVVVVTTLAKFVCLSAKTVNWLLGKAIAWGL